MKCFVLWNGGAWFAKEQRFFEQQRAAAAPSDTWWHHWQYVGEVDGLEHAKDRARLTWGERGERWTVPSDRPVSQEKQS